MEHGASQIKPMLFHIAKHFFSPHSSFIKLEGCGQVMQIRRQAPRLFLSQIVMPKQDALPKFLDITFKSNPFAFPVEADHESLDSEE